MNTELKFLEIDGARLAYERHVHRAELGVLVFGRDQGLGSSGPAYRPLLSLLARHFEVYALDLRWHRGSAGSGAGGSEATLADDLAAFVEVLGLKGATFVGHASSGYTGLLAEVRHPGTFLALCLLGPALVAERTTLATNDPACSDDECEPSSRMNFDAPRNVPLDLPMAEPAAGQFQTVDSNLLRLVQPDESGCATFEFRYIEAPVLMLDGGRGIVFSLEEPPVIVRGLRICKQVILSDDGRMLPIEAPDLTAREIVNFRRYDVREFRARRSGPPVAPARKTRAKR